MATPPTGTLLGQLEITQVLLEYDGPCLFICRNRAGHMFLANWVAASADEDTWLYVAASPARLLAFLSGEVDLRSMYTGAEDGRVIELVTPRDGPPARLRVVPVAALTDAQLAEPGVVIEHERPAATPDETALWVEPGGGTAGRRAGGSEQAVRLERFAYRQAS
jgi:hypothetical protein